MFLNWKTILFINYFIVWMVVGVETLLMGNSKCITVVKFKIYALTFSIKVSPECFQSVQPTGKNPAVVKKILYTFYLFCFFQFLEQRYGFFHCKKCNIRWESAYVWCISGTSKVSGNEHCTYKYLHSCWAKIERLLWQVYYKQLCRKCQVGFNPYRVESILCKVRELVFEEPSQDDLFTWT